MSTEAERIAVVENTLVSVARQVDEMHKVLCVGNGTPGLLTRVDRLEQSAERSKWWTRAAGGAALTALVANLKDFVMKGGNP
jgi:hypothetical protein